MNKDEKLPKATAAQADRLDFLTAQIKRERQEGNECTHLARELHRLIRTFDWYDEIFEENGKKGLRNVRGEVVVPAIYDELLYPCPYYLPSMLIGAAKDGMYAMVERDGKGTPCSEFEYQHVEPIPFTLFDIAVKADDLQHFAIMVKGKVFTPFEMVDYDMPCDDHVILKGDNNKCGIIGMSSLIYIAPIYDEVISNGIGTDFIFIKDGVKGRVTTDKRFVGDEEFNNMSKDEQDKLLELGFISVPDLK